MIIDCEPICFMYGGKNWMIELWKGQYGLETGGEIGVYNAAENRPPTQIPSPICFAVGSRLLPASLIKSKRQ